MKTNVIITLKRIAKKSDYTIGHLYIEGEHFCDTLEDTDRGLSYQTPDEVIKDIKEQFPGHVCIPSGCYEIDLDTVSPKYSKNKFMLENANGARVPRLRYVPGFEGILIHTGNTADDSEGCILVGKNNEVGRVNQSRDTFKALYKKLKSLEGTIYIDIQ